MPFRPLLGLFGLAAVLATISTFVWASFQPESRFLTPRGSWGTKLHCVFDAIYLSDPNADVLVFGTSRTKAAVNAGILERELTARVGKTVRVVDLSFVGANPGLSYQFLSEYVSRHKPPKLIIFEAQQVRESPSVAPYVNRFFSIAAKPDLYLDILFHLRTPSLVNRLADVSRLMIDHLDKSLNKALSPWDSLWLDSSNLKCRVGAGMAANEESRHDVVSDASPRPAAVEALKLRAAVAEASNPGSSAGDDAGKPKKKQKRSGKKKKKMRQLAEAQRERGTDWEQRPAWDWQYTLPPSERYLFYYDRFVDLAEQNNAKVVFLRLPGYLEPPSTPVQTSQFEALVNAPVLVPGLDTLRKIYPSYNDRHHVGPPGQPLLMEWLADQLVERVPVRNLLADQSANDR